MTRKHRWTKLVALSLTIVALAIPSLASASPAPAAGTYDDGPADYAPATPTVVASPTSGFSWEDALIGASIAVAVGVIGVGSVLVVRSLRADRARFELTG